jgi:hypothetical protein
LSFDSEHYLKTAEDILKGDWLVSYKTQTSSPESSISYTAVWPIGYPLLIAATSYCTGTDAFTASKIVNIIFLGFIFLLLHHHYGVHSLLPACYFCSFSMLEIYSYTWSEGAFLFFLLLMLHVLKKLLYEEIRTIHVVLLAACLIAMALLRYAGLIYFIFTFLVMLWSVYRRNRKYAWQIGLALFSASLCIMPYLMINYYYTGGFFGGHPRYFPEAEQWHMLMSTIFKGVLNELFIMRNFYFTWDYLFFIALFIQGMVMVYLFQKSKLSTKRVTLKGEEILILSGIFYLMVIVFIKTVSPLDTFDYRILAPFSAPIFIALLGNFTSSYNTSNPRHVPLVIIGFFMLSLVLNLPKMYVLEILGLK